VFILSQQDDRASIEKLIEIARTDKDREVRKKAIFWLGQTDDDLALKFLEELIDR
jgi:HEAT repeat protein